MIKKLYPWMLVAVVLAAVLYWAVSTYNEMKYEQERVETAWSQVENQYGRRAKWVQDLLGVVRAYPDYDQQALDSVEQACSQASQMLIDPAKSTPEQLVAYQRMQADLGHALGLLVASIQADPEMAADQQIHNLQLLIQGSEAHVAKACQLFNESAYNYNRIICRFPNSMLSAMFGFRKRPYFETEEQVRYGALDRF